MGLGERIASAGTCSHCVSPPSSPIVIGGDPNPKPDRDPDDDPDSDPDRDPTHDPDPEPQHDPYSEFLTALSLSLAQLSVDLSRVQWRSSHKPAHELGGESTHEADSDPHRPGPEPDRAHEPSHEPDRESSHPFLGPVRQGMVQLPPGQVTGLLLMQMTGNKGQPLSDAG